jgi:hypothetical protein
MHIIAHVVCDGVGRAQYKGTVGRLCSNSISGTGKNKDGSELRRSWSSDCADPQQFYQSPDTFSRCRWFLRPDEGQTSPQRRGGASTPGRFLQPRTISDETS